MDSYLSLHFIWDSQDKERVKSILEILLKSFARDKDFPFSRQLNLPLFFYCSNNNKEMPTVPQYLSEKNIVFIFISENSLCSEWEKYYNSIKSCNCAIIPVALESSALKLGAIDLTNAIRVYDFTKLSSIHTAINMAHEIFCHGLSLADSKSNENKQVKIFLSHCKADNETGEQIAKKIKEKIDNETTVKNFFDNVGIGGGENFEQTITNEIKKSTLICINSDHYSSRFWCQKEILLAKEHNRPIIGVDCLTNIEDRAFPYKGNIPFIRYQFDSNKEDECIYNILFTALIETIRVHYVEKEFKNYINNNWLDKKTCIFTRPPESWQLASIKKNSIICYPEPPIYSIELKDQIEKNIQFRTPLWNPSSDFNSLQNQKIGISISDFDDISYLTTHISLDTLKLLSQDIARSILSRSASLVYGGDLRQDGFTDFLLDEAYSLYERTKNNNNPINSKIYNYLAWYIHNSNPQTQEYKKNYYNIIEQKLVSLPDDINEQIFDETKSYGKARCLTYMREQMISNNNAQIFAGGKHKNYSGILPGILEEFIIALKKEIPIFLLAGFGGITNSIYTSIKNNSINEKITKHWQINNNPKNYNELLTIAQNNRKLIDYDEIEDILKNMTIKKLASQSGLSEKNYKKMAETPFINVAIYYLLQGLENKFKRNDTLVINKYGFLKKLLLRLNYFKKF